MHQRLAHEGDGDRVARRVGDRRAPPRDSARDASGASARLPDFNDLEIVVGDDDIEEIEQTLVRENPIK